jgi:hypothetical protein
MRDCGTQSAATSFATLDELAQVGYAVEYVDPGRLPCSRAHRGCESVGVRWGGGIPEFDVIKRSHHVAARALSTSLVGMDRYLIALGTRMRVAIV